MLSSNLIRTLSILATATLGLAACGDDTGTGGTGGADGTGGAGGSPDASSATTSAGGTQNTGGAGQGGGAGGGEAGVWEKFCEDKSARAEKCGHTPDTPEQLEACKAKASCWEAATNPTFLEKYAECANRPCDESEDPCAAAAAEATPATEATGAFAAACEAKKTECPAADLDFCEGPHAWSDSLAATFTACLDKPCEEADACAVEAFVATFEPCGGK